MRLVEIALLGLLFGILIHAVLLGRYVAQREPSTGQHVAILLIFFSGMWYIGPFAYFGFRQSRPLLAQACLRQMIAVTALWILLMFLSAAGVDLWAVSEL